MGLFFDVLLTVHISIFSSVINPLNAELNSICHLLALLGTHHILHISRIRVNQLDAQKFCFPISLFHASTCFEHVCSSSGGQSCITQPLVLSHL